MEVISTTEIVESLIAKIIDKNGNVHDEAIKGLVNIGIPAVGPLIKVAEDNSRGHSLRLFAIGILGQIGDKRAVDTLIAGLADSEWQVRIESMVALKKIGDKRAVDPIIIALEDSDLSVRAMAADALMKFGDNRAVAPLISVLTDPSELVRCNAANALVQFGVINGDNELCSSAVEVFIAVLDDNENKNVNNFLFALNVASQICGKHIEPMLNTRIVKSLITKLDHDRFDFRKPAAKTLVAIYKTGHLDESCRELIAQQRSKITEPYTHIEGTEYDGEYWGGGEYGIGVDFPD